jgi:hypothetical protein
MRGCIEGRTFFSMIPPLCIAMPIDEANQIGVDLSNKPPDPVFPKGLKAFDSRPPDWRPPRS